MRWLADRSAIIRLDRASEPALWSERIATHQVHISGITLLEFGVASRSAAEWERAIDRPPLSLLPRVAITNSVEDRALEVQGLLAKRGQHRAPSLADLLIAAAAELHDLTVLHIDKDFELIADITGQPVERLVVAPQ